LGRSAAIALRLFCAHCSLKNRPHQQRQAAYIDVFWLLMILEMTMIPVALIIKPIDLSAPPKGH
jgi:hypothetical protein